METLAYVTLFGLAFLLLVGVVYRRDRRRGRGRSAAESAHAWHHQQRHVGDDAQWITDQRD